MLKIKANKRYIKFCMITATLAIFLLSMIFSYDLNNLTSYAAAENPVVNVYGFTDGDGSENDPFVIRTSAQLDNMRNYLKYPNPDYDPSDIGGGDGGLTPLAGRNGESSEFLPYYFALGADINLNDALALDGWLYGDGNGWLPIGSGEFDADFPWQKNYFHGVLDGRGHTVSNLWINRPEAEYVGLFGAAYDTAIIDLNIIIEKKGITGKSGAGGIAGLMVIEYDEVNSIEFCSVKGSINTTDMEENVEGTGGLAGAALNLEITASFFEGTLSGRNYIGRLAGYANGVKAENCYVKATLQSAVSPRAGGIFGVAVGWGVGNIVNRINRCYADLVCASVADAFAGDAIHPFDTVFSYYTARDNVASDGEKYYTDNVSALSEADKKLKSSYEDFNFDSIWGFDRDNNLVLRYFGKAYDMPVPQPQPDLTWLYIFLPSFGFAAAVIITALMLYRRKKSIIVTEIKTVTVTNSVEVIKEVHVIKKPLPQDLSKKERQVAELILRGKSRSKIAAEMKISVGAAGSYMSRVYTKAGVDGQKDFIIYYLGCDEEN